MRVEILQAIRRRGELAAADVVRAVEDLALQVGDIHGVEIHDPEVANACGREIEGGR